MCFIKESLCRWINLSGGLSYSTVILFIMLSLSDEKKYIITSDLPKRPLVHCTSVYVCVGAYIRSRQHHFILSASMWTRHIFKKGNERSD